MPSFVMDEAKTTWKRFIQWQGNDDCLVFPIVTDIHTYNRDTYKHIGYAAKTNDLFNYDFFANLGDTGIDGGEDTEEIDYDILYKTIKEMSKFTGDIAVLCKENHDYGKLPITQTILSNALMKPLLRKNKSNVDIVYNSDHVCGYFDIDRVKIRVFFLNTSDGNTGSYTMSKEQLIFLADSFKTTKPGYHVIILTHFCNADCGKWTTYPNTTMTNKNIYIGILSSFVSKTSGSLNDVSWDFTDIDSSCKLVANFCGDSHFDSSEVYQGVLFTTTQGYGGVSDADKPVKLLSVTHFNY